ncbi:MAG: RNA polymerase sigma factor SigM [Jiangellales bacterium]
MTSGSPPTDETGPSDAELLAAHVGGSPTAFGMLVSRHHDHLWAVALRMMRSPEDAADVLQDAMIKAFRAAPGFRGEAAVSTWLHRITVNTSLDALRARSRKEVLGFDQVDRTWADLHDPLATREASLDVAAALAAIPADQRAAVVLVDMVGFSVAEAADVIECPEGTVKSRCSRGRARLAEMLTGYEPHPRPEADDADPGNPGPRLDVEPPGEAPSTPAARTEEQA